MWRNTYLYGIRGWEVFDLTDAYLKAYQQTYPGKNLTYHNKSKFSPTVYFTKISRLYQAWWQEKKLEKLT